jgi:spoIIIJ-associated protein
MRSIEQTGRTVDEAVEAALKALDITRDEADIEVLAEEKAGLLGILGHTEARVRVTPKATLGDRAVEILTEILDLMGLDVEVELVADDAEAVSIDMRSGNDTGILIGKRGQTLAALQLIVAMMANRDQPPELRKRVVLDAEGYRERRERTVRAMARTAAQRAERSGRPVTLEALNPRERRIVHIALGDERGVTTRSEGEDPNRVVIVSPRRERRE